MGLAAFILYQERVYVPAGVKKQCRKFWVETSGPDRKCEIFLMRAGAVLACAAAGSVAPLQVPGGPPTRASNTPPLQTFDRRSALSTAFAAGVLNHPEIVFAGETSENKYFPNAISSARTEESVFKALSARGYNKDNTIFGMYAAPRTLHRHGPTAACVWPSLWLAALGLRLMRPLGRISHSVSHVHTTHSKCHLHSRRSHTHHSLTTHSPLTHHSLTHSPLTHHSLTSFPSLFCCHA